MQTSVSVRLRVYDIILHLNHANIILIRQHLCRCINIIGEGANHANPCHIRKVFLNPLHADFKALSLQLFYNTLGRFDSALN